MNTTVRINLVTQLPQDECSRRLAALLDETRGFLGTYSRSEFRGWVAADRFQMRRRQSGGRYEFVRWDGAIIRSVAGTRLILTHRMTEPLMVLIGLHVVALMFQLLVGFPLLMIAVMLPVGVLNTLFYGFMVHSQANRLRKLLGQTLDAQPLPDGTPAASSQGLLR